MGKIARKGIIAKKADGRGFDWWFLGILVLAAFLRVFRLEALTEFLGDQGRTMLVMYNWVNNGIIPLSGPTTLNGQVLGPFFYYLLLPGYVLSHGPTGVSLWTAILGIGAVVILYDLVRRRFGTMPARFISLLWSVSPLIVTSDRVIWEPNLVPLFALSYLYLLYRSHYGDRGVYWILLGCVIGILIQLHYPNILFIGLTVLYACALAFSRQRMVKKVLKDMGLTVLGFILVCIPFAWYEYSVKFQDIVAIIKIFLGTGSGHVGKLMIITNAADFSFRVFSRAFPDMSIPAASALSLLWIAFAVTKRTKTNIFISVWFIFGIAAMSMYSGVVYDHYLNFLTPVPFLMAASVLSEIRSKQVITICLFIVFGLSMMQLSKTDIFSAGTHDIQRTSEAVQAIVNHARKKPFSFTLVKSRSFSDLHYRYYFEVMHAVPTPITSANYSKLFLVCDQGDCPTVSDLSDQTQLNVMCYEPHCAPYYPTVNVRNDWVYEQSDTINTTGNILATVYEYHRK